MRIDYADALKKGLKFCVQPKRWLPFFIVDIVFVSVAFMLFVPNMSYLFYLMAGIEDPTVLAPMSGIFLTLIVLFVIWMLISIWIQGAVIHQSVKEKEFRNSWGAAGRRYVSLLGVVVITAVLGFAVSPVPYIGLLFAIFIGLLFFFAMQSVIVKGNSITGAVRDTTNIFVKQPFKVFLMWLLISIISILIVAAFAMPLFAVFASIMADVLVTGGAVSAAALMGMLLALQSQMGVFIVTGIILLAGLAISRAFAIKAQTEFYMQVKKIGEKPEEAEEKPEKPPARVVATRKPPAKKPPARRRHKRAI
jgi:hypothetical protein